jgi:hypothetical protein
MAELLVQFDEAIVDDGGTRYVARVFGEEDDIHRWAGWLEFASLDGDAVISTDHETVQPNRRDLEYWATGLTRVYLNGALVRARQAEERAATPPRPRPHAESARSRREEILDTMRRRSERLDS